MAQKEVEACDATDVYPTLLTLLKRFSQEKVEYTKEVGLVDNDS